VAALFWEPVDQTVRFIAIALSIALICLALPPRVWGTMRTWWSD
jgi:hypothetical protein